MIPEIELHNIVKALLKSVRSDYDDNGGTPSDTILYYLLNGQGSTGKFNYFSQGVETFITRDEHDPKYLDTRLFFDRERASVPTIHIMSNGEQNNHISLGVDLGYLPEQVIGGEQRAVYNRHFDINLSIIITSDNSLETTVIYHVIKSMLLSCIDHIQLKGFINPQISGRDLNISQELVPSGIFSKVIEIRTGYELAVPEVVLKTIVSKVHFLLTSVIE